MALVLITPKGRYGSALELPLEMDLEIGSSDTCHIRFNIPGIQPSHVKIRTDGTSLQLYAMGSDVRVNGEILLPYHSTLVPNKGLISVYHRTFRYFRTPPKPEVLKRKKVNLPSTTTTTTVATDSTQTITKSKSKSENAPPNHNNSHPKRNNEGQTQLKSIPPQSPSVSLTKSTAITPSRRHVSVVSTSTSLPSEEVDSKVLPKDSQNDKQCRTPERTRPHTPEIGVPPPTPPTLSSSKYRAGLTPTRNTVVSSTPSRNNIISSTPSRSVPSIIPSTIPSTPSYNVLSVPITPSRTPKKKLTFDITNSDVPSTSLPTLLSSTSHSLPFSSSSEKELIQPPTTNSTTTTPTTTTITTTTTTTTTTTPTSTTVSTTTNNAPTSNTNTDSTFKPKKTFSQTPQPRRKRAMCGIEVTRAGVTQTERSFHSGDITFTSKDDTQMTESKDTENVLSASLITSSAPQQQDNKTNDVVPPQEEHKSPLTLHSEVKSDDSKKRKSEKTNSIRNRNKSKSNTPAALKLKMRDIISQRYLSVAPYSRKRSSNFSQTPKKLGILFRGNNGVIEKKVHHTTSVRKIVENKSEMAHDNLSLPKEEFSQNGKVKEEEEVEVEVVERDVELEFLDGVMLEADGSSILDRVEDFDASQSSHFPTSPLSTHPDLALYIPPIPISTPTPSSSSTEIFIPQQNSEEKMSDNSQRTPLLQSASRDYPQRTPLLQSVSLRPHDRIVTQRLHRRRSAKNGLFLYFFSFLLLFTSLLTSLLLSSFLPFSSIILTYWLSFNYTKSYESSLWFTN
jgi:hypothetical protein